MNYEFLFRPSPGSDVLRKHYVDDRRSIEWLCNHFHTWYHCVVRWLAEAEIPVRAPGDNGRRIDLDPEIVRELYVNQGMTIAEICKELGRSERPIRRAMKEAGIACRRSGPREHKKKKVKYNKTSEPEGYVLVYAPSHPKANAKGRVREHILVMEQKLGRLLKDSEVVHHIDEDKTNNNPDNLAVFSSHGEHTRFHNLERSTAKVLHQMTTEELAELYSEMSTVKIAEVFETSPASVQREFARRGFRLRSGPHRKGVQPVPRKPEQQKPNHL